MNTDQLTHSVNDWLLIVHPMSSWLLIVHGGCQRFCVCIMLNICNQEKHVRHHMKATLIVEWLVCFPLTTGCLSCSLFKYLHGRSTMAFLGLLHVQYMMASQPLHFSGCWMHQLCSCWLDNYTTWCLDDSLTLTSGMNMRDNSHCVGRQV